MEWIDSHRCAKEMIGNTEEANKSIEEPNASGEEDHFKSATSDVWTVQANHYDGDDEHGDMSHVEDLIFEMANQTGSQNSNDHASCRNHAVDLGMFAEYVFIRAAAVFVEENGGMCNNTSNGCVADNPMEDIKAFVGIRAQYCHGRVLER